MGEEGLQKLPLMQMTNNALDTMPVFREDPNTSGDNRRKEVLRGVFMPMVLNTVSRGRWTSQQWTPEDILNDAVKDGDLKITPDLIQQLSDRYHLKENTGGTDWLKEVLSMSLEGIKHPLNQLTQEVKGKLPANLREELTKTALTE